MVLIVVGSVNPSKLNAVEIAATALFPDGFSVRGVTVPSGVRSQPLSERETIQGAIQRAKNALAENGEADFGIGLEGGLCQCLEVPDSKPLWFEEGWCAIINRGGVIGLASTAKLEMSERIVKELIENGKELADVVDEISGKTDVRSTEGVMGCLTNGALPRDIAYSHAVMFAFARFVSSKIWWD